MSRLARFRSSDPELWHQLAHDADVDDPGLFMHICASELSLIMLGLPSSPVASTS